MRQLHPGLNLNNIKFFLDAARLESVSLAAEANAVTQSAVSQGIQRLEKAIGVPLTNHQRNAFALTSEGKRVVAYAQQIMNLIEEMSESLEADVRIKYVEFGCTISIAKAWLPKLMTEIKEKHPDIIVKPQVCDFDSLIDSLRKGKIEFAIGINDPRFSEFDLHVLYNGNFGVYSSASNLQDGLYVDSCSHPYVHLLAELYKEKYKKPLKILGETNSWELVVCFVENNLGCGFFPDFLLTAGEKKVKLVSSKLPKIPYEISAFFRKGERLTKGAQAVLSLLEDVK